MEGEPVRVAGECESISICCTAWGVGGMLYVADVAGNMGNSGGDWKEGDGGQGIRERVVGCWAMGRVVDTSANTRRHGIPLHVGESPSYLKKING